MPTSFRRATREIPAAIAIAAIAVSCSAIVSSARAADGEPSLAFRRVLVPEAEIKDWPRGNQRFIPLDGAEFEQLVRRAQRADHGDKPSLDAQIAAARYSAELSGDELIGGRANLDIKVLGKTPIVVPLHPCRLAIEAPKWIPATVSAAASPLPNDNSAASAPEATSEPVPIGVGADGKWAIRVAMSGRVEFGWTLHGQRETGGGIAFSLQLPQCPSNQLELSLPSDLAPTVDQALVTPLSDSTAAATSNTAGFSAKRRWLVELSGQNVALLRIAKRDVIHQRRPLTLARQSLTYEFSPLGMQLSAELKLDVLGEPIRQLALDIDAPLAVVTARYGDVQLAWYEEPARTEKAVPLSALPKKSDSKPDDAGVPYPSKSHPHRIVLQLPEALRGSGRVLRIGATAPLSSSGRLPTIRPASSDVVWQEGTALVLIPQPLEVSELRTAGCRQVKQESLPAPTEGEAMTFQFFRPDADLVIGLRRPENRFGLKSGTAIEAIGATMTGRMVVDLTADRGETFSLSAEIAAGWIIDSVDSPTAGVVANWSVAPTRAGVQRLTINLAKGLRGDRPLRLSIGGRWGRQPLGETLRSADFTMAKFQGAAERRRIVLLHAAAPFKLQLTGAEHLNRLSADHLDPADAALLGGSTGGIVFVADSQAAAISVAVARETPRYSGAVHLSLRAGDDSLSESYSFICTPESTEIDHLLIHFARPQPEPLEWELIEDQRGGAVPVEPVVARKLNLTPAALGALGLAEGEVWELTWRQPKTEPFTIRATRTSPLISPVPVSLASFVQAASQQGTVEIRSTGQHVCEVQNRRLRAVPVSLESSDQWPRVLAIYRYDPQQEAIQPASDAVASLTIGPGKALPDAWVWSLSLNSHFAAKGHCEHVGSWRIENLGRTRIAFQFAAANIVDGVWIDGNPVGTESFDEKSGQLLVNLPADRRFVTIVLKWSSDGPPMSIVSSRTVELPEFDLPVVSQSIRLWLPPNYRLLKSGEGRESNAAVSWSQRLFGPFGRPAGDGPFDPLSVADWRGAVGPLGQNDAAWSVAQQLADRMGQLALSRASTTTSGGETTWAMLLSRAQADVAAERIERATPLLVDQQALSDIGLSARTAIARNELRSGEASLLANSDLVILVSAKDLILTTRSAAAGLIDRTLTPADGVCVRLPVNSVERRSTAAIDGNDSRFVPFEFWGVAEAGLPWPASGDDMPPIDHAGWVEYRLDSFDGSGPRIWLVRRDAIIGLGCGVFLLTTLLVWRKWTNNWRARALMVVAAAALALTMPSSFSPLGAGLWMGFCCGGLLRWITPVPTVQDAGPPNGSTRRTPRDLAARVGAIVLIGLLAGSRWLSAAETSPTDQSAEGAIFDVLIPIDDQQRPVGRELLVPEPLYEQLVRRAGRQVDASKDWLITSASYHGQLGHGGDQNAVGAADWTARYELQTFESQSRVIVPFGQEGVNLLPDGVRLDGRSVQFEWKESGQILAIDVPQAGPHQLELTFRPVPQTNNGATSISFAILPMPGSVLQLELPADLQVEFPSSLGHLVRDQNGQRLSGPLSPADKLTVRWGDSSSLDSARPLIDAEEMLWLKIRPGSVVLDARFDLHIAEGKLHEVQLAADPRLRRLPLEASSPIAQVRSDAGNADTLDLSLVRATADQLTFKLSFLLTDSSGVGQLQVPKLNMIGVRNLRRRLAISVEPPLAADEKALGKLTATTVGDFLSAWGSADSKPQSAYLLPDAENLPVFAIHPRSPQLTSNDSLVVSLDELRLRAAWLTDVEVQGGTVYQLGLAVPPDFQVSDTELVEKSGVHRPARWSREPTGAVTVFLPGNLEDRIRLLVRGEAPVALDKPAPLPELRVQDCKIDSQTVLVYRSSTVIPTVVNRGELTQQTGKELKGEIDRALADGLTDPKAIASQRLVAALAGKLGAAPISLRVGRNVPAIQGSEMITMRRDGDAWTAVADLDIKVSEGVLDAVQFDLPFELSEAVSVEPPMAQESLAAAGDDRRRLVLHPTEPIAGSRQIRLTIPVATIGGHRVRVPDIRPVGLGALRRFVRLPTNFNGQQLIWEPHGLTFERLPASFAMTSSTTEVYRTCEVIGDKFEAVLKSVATGSASPRVRSAEIRLVMATQKSGYGTASFDVDPAGAIACLLDMPSEFRLVYAEFSGGPAVRRQVAPNQWNIAFADARLPQRLEIVFLVDRTITGRIGDGPTFRPPSLVGFTVEQTLWSIDAAESVKLASDQEAAKPISRLKQEIMDLDNAAATLETTAGLVANDAEQGLSPIVAFEARRLLSARAEVDRQRKRATAMADRRSAEAAIRAAEAAQDELARRFGLQEQFADLERQGSVAGGPSELGRAMSEPGRTTTIFAAAGPVGSLAVLPWETESDGFAARWPAALAIVSIITGLFWMLERTEIGEIAARRPQRMALAAGVAWWFWLEPSIIGLAIFVISLAFPIWHRRRGRGRPRPLSRVEGSVRRQASGKLASSSVQSRLQD